MSAHEIEFRRVMEAAGLNPAEIAADGNLRRHGTKAKPNSQNGWHVLFGDAPVSGAFGDWTMDSYETWTVNDDRPLTREEREAFRQRMEQTRAAKEKATAERHAEAVAKAQARYANASPCSPRHPYLARKGVPVLGDLRKANDGRIMVPAHGPDGKLQTIQYIGADGEKRFLTGGKVAGGFFAIKAPGENSGPLHIVEGYATGASVYLATGTTVLCAFTAGNLKAVAEMARKLYPEREIILAADDDLSAGNPGLTKATEAARAINAKLAVPIFLDHVGRSDFNDMAAEQGVEAVRAVLATAKPPDVPESVDAPGVSLHLEMARACLASFGAGNIVFTMGDFWQWDGSGIWRKIDPQEVKRAAHKLYPDKIKSAHTANSILELAKTETFMDGREFTPPEGRSINCLSGVLDWTGQKWELRPHRREDYFTAQLPVVYDPNAVAPRFEKFLAEVFHGDEDAFEKTILICEALGYSCLSTTDFEKFLLLIGSGANGKSVLLNILGALVGRENVCAVQPSQFDNRFQRAHLHGKLVNVVSEIAEGAEIADAQLKAIVSGELTTAEHKLKAPFDFRPYATCWFGTNHMPHTRDFSQALFRRALIITFNRVFAEHEQDKLLSQTLKAELPGIFTMALDALEGVFKRGVFTMPRSSEQARQEWRVQADQVAQFAEECCRFGPDLSSPSGTVFSRYLEWAGGAGIVRKLSRNNFTARMVRLGAIPHKGAGGSRSLRGVEVAA